MKVKGLYNNSSGIRTITLESIALFIFTMFAFSRQSWGLYIPSEVWGVLLVGSSVILIVEELFVHKGYVSFSWREILLFLLLLIMTFYNNYELDTSGDYIRFIIIYYSLLIMYSYGCHSFNGDWSKVITRLVKLMATWYAIMTVVCYVFPAFYYNVIAPIFRKVGMTNGNEYPATGFTTTSTNNGIYITVGLCVVCCELFFSNKDKKRGINIFLLVLLILALFLSGKRGILISFIVAFIMCYRNYNSNKPLTRGMKLILLSIVILAILYVVSLFNPSLFYVVNKTIDLFQNNGDITNGRLILWETAWNNFLEKPWVGYGWRWFRYNNGVSYLMDVHNVYLQLLVEVGFIGFALFLLFFLVSFIKVYRMSIIIVKKPVSIEKRVFDDIYISLMFQTFVLVYMLVGTPIYTPEGLFVYLFSCAMAENCQRRLWRQEKVSCR